MEKFNIEIKKNRRYTYKKTSTIENIVFVFFCFVKYWIFKSILLIIFREEMKKFRNIVHRNDMFYKNQKKTNETKKKFAFTHLHIKINFV